MLLATAFTMLKSIDFNSYKSPVQRHITELLGRTLTITGDIQLDIDFESRLVIGGLQLRNADWGSRDAMVSIERAEVEVELLPLLFGDIRIGRLELVNSSILLETDNNGRSNWHFEPVKDKNLSDSSENAWQADNLPNIDHILITNVNLNYKDTASGKQTQLLLDSIEAKMDNLHAVFKARITGTIDKQTFTLSARVNEFGELLSQQSAPLKLDLEYNNKKHNRIKARMSGELGITPSDYRIEELQLTLDENRLTGSVYYDFSLNKPTLNADLQFKSFDLRRLTSKNSNAVSNKRPKKDKLFSAEKMDFSLLKDINANITIKGEKILGSSLALDNLSLTAKLVNGVLKISPLRLDVGGSTLHNKIILDTRKKTPQLKLSSRGKQFRLGEMLEKTDTTDMIIGAPANIDILLQGSGDSPAALTSSLSGRIVVDIGRGRVNNEYLNLMGTDLTANLWSKFDSSKIKKDPYTEFECAVINLHPRNGIIKYDKKVAMETDEMVIVSSGIIDLKRETLKIAIVPKPHKTTKGLGLGVGEFVGIVQIKGSLANPELGVDDDKTALKVLEAFGTFATGGSYLLLKGLTHKVFADPNPCQTAKGIKKSRNKGVRETMMKKFLDFKNKF